MLRACEHWTVILTLDTPLVKSTTKKTVEGKTYVLALNPVADSGLRAMKLPRTVDTAHVGGI